MKRKLYLPWVRLFYSRVVSAQGDDMLRQNYGVLTLIFKMETYEARKALKRGIQGRRRPCIHLIFMENHPLRRALT